MKANASTETQLKCVLTFAMRSKVRRSPKYKRSPSPVLQVRGIKVKGHTQLEIIHTERSALVIAACLQSCEKIRGIIFLRCERFFGFVLFACFLIFSFFLNPYHITATYEAGRKLLYSIVVRLSFIIIFFF